MNIILSNTDSAPIYEQITRQLRAKIVSGELAPGAALPSMRLLAKELRISVITTKRAYNDLQQDGYKAIFIGTGVWRPKKLGIPGESLGHVHFAIDYLVNPDVYELGDRLAVIGAGNSAMDVARTALRKGVKSVSVFCRRREAAASSREVDYATADGVEFLYGARPLEIIDNGIIYQQASFDGDGAVAKLSEPKYFPADSVVIAVSQGPKDKIVSTTTGLNITDRGLLATDTHGNTSRPSVFASGDVVLGARTVVEAVKYSKEVARAMDEYLRSIG